MFNFSFTESVGYIATLVVIISFAMKGINRLRAANTVGCVLFIYYGFLISSVPVIITNLIIMGINLFHLFIKKQPAPPVGDQHSKTP